MPITRTAEVVVMHDRNAEPLRGGFEQQLAGIEMVDSGGFKAGEANGVFPGAEAFGHFLMDEEGLS